jgi:hypothetical protein
MTGADFVIVWDGRARVVPAPPVAPPRPSLTGLSEAAAGGVAEARRILADRRRRARANKARPVLTLAHKRRIWRYLEKTTTAKAIAHRLGVPVTPVGVLLSKAVRAGLVVRVGWRTRKGRGRRGPSRKGLYTRAAGAPSSAINFPPISGKVYQA